MPAIRTKRVVLFGIEDPLARELHTVLTDQSLHVQADQCHTLNDCVRQLDDSHLIFCSNTPQLINLLAAVSAHPAKVPVVVVSRHPEVREWLDAIEAGAADYCAAPFELRQLHWLLESNMSRQAPVRA